MAQVTAVRNAAGQHAYERLQHPRLLELWTGNFDIGLCAGARQRPHRYPDHGVQRRRAIPQADKVAVYFNQIYGTARVNNLTSTIASAIRGGWTYNRDVTPRFSSAPQQLRARPFSESRPAFRGRPRRRCERDQDARHVSLDLNGGRRLLARKLHRRPPPQLRRSEFRRQLRCTSFQRDTASHRRSASSTT